MSKSASKTTGSKPVAASAATPMWRRLLPCVGFVLGLLVLVVLAYDDGYGALPPVEKRYTAARDALERLRNDAKRNIYRDQWLKLADEFHDIYQRDTTWVNRPAALYRSAEVLEELGSRSFAVRDYKAAVERYELLARKHASSRLADDALLRVAVIKAKHLDDRDGALKVVRQMRSQYPRGDMTADAVELEKTLLAEARAEASRADPAAGQGEKRAATPDSAVGAGGTDKSPSRPDAASAPMAGNARLTQVSWTSLSRDKVQITVELNRHAPWQVRMHDADKKGGSPRLVLQVDDAVPVEQVQAGARVKGSLLTRVRVTRDQDKNTLLAFDFSAARRYDAKVEQNPFRIVLTVTAGNTAPLREAGARLGFAENTLPGPDGAVVAEARVASARKASEEARETAVRASRSPRPVAEARAARADEDKAPQRVRASGAAVAGNLAEQLGLTVQTVFIDAGHGGKDPGTLHNGVVEREVVLDISRRVGRMLSANGLDVVYSRSSDASVPLSLRPQKANSARADLFVSIHVNAHPDANISGFETFYLDLARNAQAARVATLENAASDRKLGDMQSVLADVMLNARTQESSRLAGDIQRRAVSRLERRGFAAKDGGTRSAPFHVLIGAGMPAVLVEVGYCTNNREARLLTSPNYRHALAEGIAEGIMAYKDRLQVRHSASLP